MLLVHEVDKAHHFEILRETVFIICGERLQQTWLLLSCHLVNELFLQSRNTYLQLLKLVQVTIAEINFVFFGFRGTYRLGSVLCVIRKFAFSTSKGRVGVQRLTPLPWRLGLLVHSAHAKDLIAVILRARISLRSVGVEVFEKLELPLRNGDPLLRGSMCFNELIRVNTKFFLYSNKVLLSVRADLSSGPGAKVGLHFLPVSAEKLESLDKLHVLFLCPSAALFAHFVSHSYLAIFRFLGGWLGYSFR